MLRVTVEVVPFGIEAAAETLDTIYIANDGTGTPEIGNYDVYTEDPRGGPYPRAERPGWVGRIENLQRGKSHRLTLAARAVNLANFERADWCAT